MFQDLVEPERVQREKAEDRFVMEGYVEQVMQGSPDTVAIPNIEVPVLHCRLRGTCFETAVPGALMEFDISQGL